MANGDDIKWSNDTMPYFPPEMPFWQRFLCLFGYHKRETRQTAKGHCYGMETEEGRRRGIFGIHDETPMRLRDQCGRCGSLLDEPPNPSRIEKIKNDECPICDGELDTGWECNSCGFDAKPELEESKTLRVRFNRLFGI